MLSMTLSNLQIAIAGRVLQAETEEAMAGVVIEIVEMPDKFKRILSLKKLQYGDQWNKKRERLDRKITTDDGSFYFVNLPAGEYILEASLLNQGTRYKKVRKTIQVATSEDKKVPTKMIEFFLLPTGIKGTITDKNDVKKVIFNAKIEIKESQETTFSDQKGNYYLLGLDASNSGQRTVTLLISATGYQPIVQSVLIKQGEVINNQNFSLNQT